MLFNEIVVSEEQPTLAATCMDVQMMAHVGVRERTEAEWRELLAKGGLTVTKIYSYPGCAESLIEAGITVSSNGAATSFKHANGDFRPWD